MSLPERANGKSTRGSPPNTRLHTPEGLAAVAKEATATAGIGKGGWGTGEQGKAEPAREVRGLAAARQCPAVINDH